MYEGDAWIIRKLNKGMGLVDGMIHDLELGSREYILSFISHVSSPPRERDRESERARERRER